MTKNCEKSQLSRVAIFRNTRKIATFAAAYKPGHKWNGHSNHVKSLTTICRAKAVLNWVRRESLQWQVCHEEKRNNVTWKSVCHKKKHLIILKRFYLTRRPNLDEFRPQSNNYFKLLPFLVCHFMDAIKCQVAFFRSFQHHSFVDCFHTVIIPRLSFVVYLFVL